MTSAFRRAIAAHLSRYEHLLEIGIGDRPGVAQLLSADASVESVTAVDVHDRSVPEGIEFVRDDVVAIARAENPPARYHVDAIYGLNLPAELQRPAATIARTVNADLLFTTLGFESPVFPVDRITLEAGTLFVVRRRPEARSVDE